MWKTFGNVSELWEKVIIRLVPHLRDGDGIRAWEVLLESDGVGWSPGVSRHLHRHDAGGEKCVRLAGHVFDHHRELITAAHLRVQRGRSWRQQIRKRKNQNGKEKHKIVVTKYLLAYNNTIKYFSKVVSPFWNSNKISFLTSYKELCHSWKWGRKISKVIVNFLWNYIISSNYVNRTRPGNIPFSSGWAATKESIVGTRIAATGTNPPQRRL